MHDGVLAHAAARRLDHMGYKYDSSDVQEVAELLPRDSSLEPVTGAGLVMQTAADGESFCSKVEKFCRIGRACPSVDDAPTNHPVHFTGRSQVQKWLHLGHVDFAELFRGFGELTIRVIQPETGFAEWGSNLRGKINDKTRIPTPDICHFQ